MSYPARVWGKQSEQQGGLTLPAVGTILTDTNRLRLIRPRPHFQSSIVTRHMLTRLLITVCAFAVSTSLVADDTPSAEPSAKEQALQEVQRLRQEAAPFQQQSQTSREQGTQLQNQLLELQQMLLKTERELQATKKSLEEAQAKLKTEQEAATKADEVKKRSSLRRRTESTG